VTWGLSSHPWSLGSDSSLASSQGVRTDTTMSSGVPLLRVLLFLLGIGGAQVLATGKPAETEIDFKYAIIGMAVGVAISAGFLALKICMIRRHLSDNDSADLKNTPQDTILLKKKSPRDAREIEL
ncbi:mCG6353, isoform CRA_b, partial [Mus musculus]